MKPSTRDQRKEIQSKIKAHFSLFIAAKIAKPEHAITNSIDQLRSMATTITVVNIKTEINQDTMINSDFDYVLDIILHYW